MSHDHLIEMCEDCEELPCANCAHESACGTSSERIVECSLFECRQDPDTCYTERAIAQAESLCDTKTIITEQRALGHAAWRHPNPDIRHRFNELSSELHECLLTPDDDPKPTFAVARMLTDEQVNAAVDERPQDAVYDDHSLNQLGLEEWT